MSDDWGDDIDDDEFCAIADEAEADHAVNVSGILDFLICIVNFDRQESRRIKLDN